MGNPLAVGIITSFVILLGYHRERCIRGGLRLWRGVSSVTSEGTVFLVLLVFVWYCVWRASAAEVDSPFTPRRLLPEIASRADLHPYTAAALRFCTSATHSSVERWRGAVTIDFEATDEIIAILGVSASALAAVWDTGSRRHVMRNRRSFVPGTEKPCPFRIRGVNTGGCQPDSMGDVDWVFPLCGGVTVTHRCKDAVCIPEAPHDIIGAGLLEAEGFCDCGAAPSSTDIRCTSRTTASC